MALGLTEVNNRRRSPQKKDIKGEKSPDEWQGVGQASTNNSGAIREQFGNSPGTTPVSESSRESGATSMPGASVDPGSDAPFQDVSGDAAPNNSGAVREHSGSNSEAMPGSGALPISRATGSLGASIEPAGNTPALTKNSETIREQFGSNSGTLPGGEILPVAVTTGDSSASTDAASSPQTQAVSRNTPPNNSEAVRKQFGSSSGTTVGETLPGTATGASVASTDHPSQPQAQDVHANTPAKNSEAVRKQFGSDSEATMGPASLPVSEPRSAAGALVDPTSGSQSRDLNTPSNNSEAVRKQFGSDSEATAEPETVPVLETPIAPSLSIDPASGFQSQDGNSPANNSGAVREQLANNPSAARALTRSSPLRSGAASKDAVPNGDYWNVSELSKKVLRLIGEHCTEHMGRICRPLTNKYIAKIVGSTEDCVKVTLRRLEKSGCIVRMKSKSGPQGWTVYQIPAAIFAAMQDDKDG